MTALPRVYARPGIPEAPGRARLHVIRSRVAPSSVSAPLHHHDERGEDGASDPARTRAPAGLAEIRRGVGVTEAPLLAAGTGAASASETIAGAAFWLLCGVLLAGSLTYSSMRESLSEARETAERLSAHSDWLACEYVRAAQVVRRVPGFARFVAQADVLGEQLAPEVRAACKGDLR